MRITAIVLSIGFALGCASGPTTPWVVKHKTLEAGARKRISTHGRWDVRGDTCIPERPPRLEMVAGPAHGTVEFRRRDRRPGDCPKAFEHAVVYYRPDADYLGRDGFSYYRINPDTGRKRLVAIEVEVTRPRGR